MKATENQPETEKNGSQCLGTMNSNVTLSKPDDGKSLLELENSEIESFYQRLNKLHNSSGLNLLFDLRQTTLGLHLFCKEVIERGGFIQELVESVLRVPTRSVRHVPVADVEYSTVVMHLSPYRGSNIGHRTVVKDHGVGQVR
ncbi:unnamed protein product [Prunus armeniaca]